MHYWKLMIMELCQVISVQCACCVDYLQEMGSTAEGPHSNFATMSWEGMWCILCKDSKRCYKGMLEMSTFCKRDFSHWDCVLFLLSIVKPLSTKIFCSGDLVTLDDNLWSSLNFHCAQYFTTLHCRKIVCHCWWIRFFGGKPEWAQR